MKRTISIILAVLFMGGFLSAQGHWEIGLHYSSWSINVVQTAIEENVIPDFDYYDPDKGPLSFDSNGSNFGLELRFFPGGEKGSFSIGISYERNYFKGTLKGSYTDSNSPGTRVEVEGNGTFDFAPHSFNINLRWELWPGSRIHPYFGVGFGFGPLNGTLGIDSRVTTYYGALSETETYREEKTLKEAIEELEQEEGESFPFKFFPIVHFQLGLRGQISGPLYFLIEGAFYDGFILRGGLALRF